MPFNLNSVCIAGRLTRDPEVKFLANERAVCNFALAINETYKSKDGEKKETTTFAECEAWGKTAELVGKYLNKGSGAYVQGRLKLEEWEDKDGKKRSRMKVVADSVQFIGGKDKAPDQGADVPTEQRHIPAPAAPDDQSPPF